jgi:hypothetical protein
MGSRMNKVFSQERLLLMVPRDRKESPAASSRDTSFHESPLNLGVSKNGLGPSIAVKMASLVLAEFTEALRIKKTDL